LTARAEASRGQQRPVWLDAIAAQALALLGAFVFAAVVGSIMVIAYGQSPVVVLRTVWAFGTSRPQDFALVLENATPLIFSGLAVAIAFKAGLFNIGVEGQYIVGMVAAAAAATGLDGLGGAILLPAVVLSAVLAGMAWAAVPAVLKIKAGAHEVVTTIMMNGIAVSLVAWLILGPLKSTGGQTTDLRTDFFPSGALVPNLATSFGLEGQIPDSVVHLTWLFPLALLACLATWVLLFRTRLGYEIRALGSSAGSAEAGGVSIGATQLKVFLISGGLAGLVGLNHILGDRGYLGSNYETGLGFAGIAIAFLGRNHPAGIPLAAILIGMLLRGQDGLAIVTDLPIEILIILQGVLILSVVVAYELVNRALTRRRLQESSLAVAAETGGDDGSR
jgi:general nucleoside transport system permease protein